MTEDRIKQRTLRMGLRIVEILNQNLCNSDQIISNRIADQILKELKQENYDRRNKGK